MGTRIADSVQYRHLWGTDELDAVFDERARLGTWLTILAAAARAQARLGIIPADAADTISEHVDPARLDLDHIAEQTRATSHSSLGFIRELQRILPPPADQYVYYGMTVQDLTDTWTVLAMREVGSIVWRDLRRLEELILERAARYRDTPMVGRTHGQPGAPITVGFKLASWADEIRRHIDRMSDGRDRWLVGQLGGAVGVLGFFGADGMRLQAEFCRELSLPAPAISWLTARDRIAEFGAALAMICHTLARIGDEVYELARPEIGEIYERTAAGTVGSITMPHKRNPEGSEHLSTLARLARAQSGVLIEAMVGSHERDGRSWKTEWIALPELCLLTGKALQLAVTLMDGLVIDTAAVSANLGRFGGQEQSERLLAGLSAQVGKHRAQEILQQESVAGHRGELAAALVREGVASADDVARWTASSPTVNAEAMVDRVIAHAAAARAAEGDTWTADRAESGPPRV